MWSVRQAAPEPASFRRAPRRLAGRLGQALLAALTLFLAVVATSSAALPAGEELHYRWRIEGLSGLVARLLPGLPATGEAVLRSEQLEGGSARHLFRATSVGAPAESHWTYTAEVDAATGATVRVVDHLRFRERDKRREHALGDAGEVDLLTAFHQIRGDLPTARIVRTLWSDEKLYAVVIEPTGLVLRSVGGRPRRLRGYSIRPDPEAEGRPWKGQAELWLEPGAPHRPVEIVFSRSFGRVRLRLLEDRSP